MLNSIIASRLPYPVSISIDITRKVFLEKPFSFWISSTFASYSCIYASVGLAAERYCAYSDEQQKLGLQYPDSAFELKIISDLLFLTASWLPFIWKCILLFWTAKTFLIFGFDIRLKWMPTINGIYGIEI